MWSGRREKDGVRGEKERLGKNSERMGRKSWESFGGDLGSWCLGRVYECGG